MGVFSQTHRAKQYAALAVLFGWLLAQPRWAQQQQIAGGSQRARFISSSTRAPVEQPAADGQFIHYYSNISTKNKSVVTLVKMAQQSLKRLK